MADSDAGPFREQLPALVSGLAFFDSPGGTQTPRQVGAAISETLTGPLSNRGTQSPSEGSAGEAVAAFRRAGQRR